MSSGSKRTRLERVAALELPPAHWRRLLEVISRRQILGRLLFAFGVALVFCGLIRGWAPPFEYRQGQVPSRAILARVSFEDPLATQRQRERIVQQVPWVYVHDPRPLSRIQQDWQALLRAVEEGSSWEDLQKEALVPSASGTDSANQETRWEAFRLAVLGVPGAEALQKVMAELLSSYQSTGFSLQPPYPQTEDHPKEIFVYPTGHPEKLRPVKLKEIWLEDALPLREKIAQHLSADPELADWITEWLWDRLQRVGGTLQWDQAATEQRQKELLAQAEPVQVIWREGLVLARAGQALSDEHVRLLRLEYEAFLAQRSWFQVVIRAAAVSLMIFAALVVCGGYLFYKNRRVLKDFRQLLSLGGLTAATVLWMRLAVEDPWQAELLPFLLFAQVSALAYGPALAMLLCGVVSLVMGLGVGDPWARMLVWLAASGAAILQTRRIRTRSKPIYIGLFAGVVAAGLTVLLGLLEYPAFRERLFVEAGRRWGWAIGAGFLMSGILPFVEKAFGVLTDISLLELTDLQHPLLQELVRRAPSTYNHSITVGTIAEAAANAIGCRGLLVRVGAYFHDIGKMLNPSYFTENQPPEEDHHASLAPTVSSLVIIAHVKDGADLARQHHLPEPIIDFIRQHHGTTRVEYFYARAAGQLQNDPNGKNGPSIDESAYRYPGPKPQSKEACVLMLADAVEGASRSLVDPTPARIQNLVHQITEKRLEDGQFDESDLTLRELRIIQDSLIKSLIAIYHARIKYPEPKPA